MVQGRNRQRARAHVAIAEISGGQLRIYLFMSLPFPLGRWANVSQLFEALSKASTDCGGHRLRTDNVRFATGACINHDVEAIVTVSEARRTPAEARKLFQFSFSRLDKAL